MKKRSVGKVLLLEATVILVAFLFCLFTFVQWEWASAFSYFIDIPSLLCLLLLVVPAVIVSGMWEDFARVFSIGKKEYTLAQMKRSLEAVKLVQRLVFCGIGFFTIITFVILLYSMLDPINLGPSMAIMALTVFYGIILEFFLAPMSAHVQNCITDVMDLPEDEQKPEISANAKLVTDDEEED